MHQKTRVSGAECKEIDSIDGRQSRYVSSALEDWRGRGHAESRSVIPSRFGTFFSEEKKKRKRRKKAKGEKKQVQRTRENKLWVVKNKK